MTPTTNPTTWHQQTSPALGGQLAAATLVVPMGATEQHGPHLPVGVDAMVADHVARVAAAQASTPQHPILVAPVLSYGSSHHHLPRPGTLSLSSDTMLAVLRDLLGSAATTGVRRLALINGHFGNDDVARQAIRDIVLTYPVVATSVSYWSVAWDDVVAIAHQHNLLVVPGHAGAFETSLMLALDAHLVDRDRVPDRRQPVPIQPSGRHPLAGPWVERHGWVAEIDGYTDGSSAASAAAGTAILDRVVAALTDFLSEFACRPVPETEAR